jgi:hypothetical protein
MHNMVARQAFKAPTGPAKDSGTDRVRPAAMGTHLGSSALVRSNLDSPHSTGAVCQQGEGEGGRGGGVTADMNLQSRCRNFQGLRARTSSDFASETARPLTCLTSRRRRCRPPPVDSHLRFCVQAGGGGCERCVAALLVALLNCCLLLTGGVGGDGGDGGKRAVRVSAKLLSRVPSRVP